MSKNLQEKANLKSKITAIDKIGNLRLVSDLGEVGKRGRCKSTYQPDQNYYPEEEKIWESQIYIDYLEQFSQCVCLVARLPKPC